MHVCACVHDYLCVCVCVCMCICVHVCVCINTMFSLTQCCMCGVFTSVCVHLVTQCTLNCNPFGYGMCLDISAVIFYCPNANVLPYNTRLLLYSAKKQSASILAVFFFLNLCWVYMDQIHMYIPVF